MDELPYANAAQANLIACQATDKVRLHDGMPTSISGKSEDITVLAKQFNALSRQNQELSKQWKAKQVNVVSVQDS